MESGKFAQIWMVVLDDAELTEGAKLLFGRLSALSVKRGYAYPKNENLARMHGCSVATIKRYIRDLRSKEYIECIEVQGRRRIYCNFDDRGNRVRGGSKLSHRLKNEPGGGSKMSHRGGSNLSQGGLKIEPHNTISSNTINSNNIKEEVRLPWEVDEFRTAWGHWKQYRKESHRFKYEPLGEQAALIKLQKLSGDNLDTALAIIEQSMAQGWKGLFKLKDNGQTDKTWEGLDAALRNRGH